MTATLPSARTFRIKIAFIGSFPSLICASMTLLFLYLATDIASREMRSILLATCFMLPIMVSMSIWVDRKWQRPLVNLITSYLSGRELTRESRAAMHRLALRFPIYTYLLNLFWWVAGAAIGAVLFTIMGIGAQNVFYIFMASLAGGLLSALFQFYAVKSFLWKTLAGFKASPGNREQAYLRSPLTIRSKLLLSFFSVIIPSLIISSLMAYSTVVKVVRNQDIEHKRLLGNAMVKELEKYSGESLNESWFSPLLHKYEAMGLNVPVLVYDRNGERLFGPAPLSIPEQHLSALLREKRTQTFSIEQRTTVLCFSVSDHGPLLCFICPHDLYSAELSTIRLVLAVCTCVLFVALVGVTLLTSGDLAGPLHRLKRTAKAIADGRLTYEVEVVSDDEVGELAWALKEMTQRLRQSNRTLESKVRERTQSLEKANKELYTLNKIKDDFLSSISHELRTPLTSIQSFSEILIRYPNEHEDTRSEFLHIIHNEAKRLTRLINDLLDLAKIESGKNEWHDETIDVEEVLTEIIKTFSVQFAEKQVTLEVRVSQSLPVLRMDRDRLVQVLTNLLSNAVKFTDIGGAITITVESIVGKRSKDKDGIIKFCVSDTGIGIPVEEQSMIFEKFVQGVTTLKQKTKGTGLGLSICKNIVSHYGGDIWVESALGQGSRFYFTIPCESGESAEHSQAALEIGHRSAEVATLSSR